MTPAIDGRVMERDHPADACAAMAARGRPFNGVLYAGLMIDRRTARSSSNTMCRFGDPETPGADDAAAKRSAAGAARGRATACSPSVDLRWHDDAALCVVMAAKGYPGAPTTRAREIRGLDAAGADPEVKIFHAGTRRDGDRLLADGGRVLGVTARGGDRRRGAGRAYAAVDLIDWPEGFCRRDIGWRAAGK